MENEVVFRYYEPGMLVVKGVRTNDKVIGDLNDSGDLDIKITGEFNDSIEVCEVFIPQQTGDLNELAETAAKRIASSDLDAVKRQLYEKMFLRTWF